MMTTAHVAFRLILISMTVPVIGGCSAPPAPRLKLVPVHGVIRFNGKPLNDAHVTFAHTTAGVSAYAVTDADGKFTLTTFQPGDGATPGKYQIAVTKAQETGHRTAKDAPPVFQKGGAPHPRWLIPQKYGNMTTSGLTADVAETGDNEIALDLKGSP